MLFHLHFDRLGLLLDRLAQGDGDPEDPVHERRTDRTLVLDVRGKREALMESTMPAADTEGVLLLDLFVPPDFSRDDNPSLIDPDLHVVLGDAWKLIS